MVSESVKLSRLTHFLRRYLAMLRKYSRYLEDTRYPNQILVALRTVDDCFNPLVLDVGSGHEARLSLPLLSHGLVVGSLDLPQQIGLAFSKLKGYPNSFCVGADALHLPFRDEVFDFIICTEVIDYLSRPIVLLKEEHRVLKRTGKILISTANARGLQHFFIHVFSLMYKLAVLLGLRSRRTLQADARKNILTLERFRSILSSSGFNVYGWIGEIGIFRILDPILYMLNIRRINSRISNLLLAMDIKVAEKIPLSLSAGWTVICEKR